MIATEKILAKNLKELRAMAKTYNIKGRSKMSRELLQRKLWEVIYGENHIPRDEIESLEFLMLHPNEMVRSMFRMWSTYGGQDIIQALEVVSRCHATTLHEESSKEFNKEFKLKISQALEDKTKATVAAIYSTVSSLSEVLNIIEEQYYAEKSLEQWQGEVLYVSSAKGYISHDRNPCEIFFYPSGETRPVGMSGWIVLHPGQKELAQKLIKEQWEYDQKRECYWVSLSDFQALKQYLDVIAIAGE